MPSVAGHCAACFGFLILSQSGERSERRGTFSCPARLSHITGSGPNQAYPLGETSPCSPDTGDCLGAGAITQFHLSKDEETNAHARRSGPANPTRVLEVEAAGPSCGGVHEISVRDAYLDFAVDPARRRITRKKMRE